MDRPQARPLTDRRINYERGTLDEGAVAADPFAQFATWLDEALATEGLIEPYAMTVASVDAQGKPDARIVLLRGFDERGFTFFTNYASRKGEELQANPHAALLFFWAALERQVRIEGSVERLSPEESDAYFAQRPRGHRLSAWASPQSRVVAGRATLEAGMRDAEERFAGVEVSRPEYWGGFRVAGERFEFWQGRRDRVHDRVVYVREASAQWKILRLAP
jgi:pyridoxamine 5'-phosphate oxidase